MEKIFNHVPSSFLLLPYSTTKNFTNNRDHSYKGTVTYTLTAACRVASQSSTTTVTGPHEFQNWTQHQGLLSTFRKFF